MQDQSTGISEVTTEMICSVAHFAALEVDGIEKMFMRLSDELMDTIYPSAVSKGVKVTELEEGYCIDLHVITRRGVEIPKVARQAQIKVKQRVEIMTGKRVSKVNIHIKGSGIY